MKKKIALLLCCMLALSACSTSTETTTEAATDGIYTEGSYTGEGEGFGGKVTVTIETDANAIVAVEIVADDETPNVGGAALEELTSQLLDAQSAEIDGVSGATFTSKGVMAAAEKAIAAAKGEEVAATGEKTPVPDGIYKAKAPSFGVMFEMALSATFEDGKITAIETVVPGSATQADEEERSAIYATVEENLFPRIIEA
ncbi:MAG: FMN-binding protein, partial [Erysipelotrichaceae bacterium]|nr:FMN-binding protein [Erysipelotrichaceae bacterium]